MTPGDILAAFPSDDASAKPLSKAQILEWMQCPDINVRGALYNILTEPRLCSRIEPPLPFADYHAFVVPYLEQCIVENPDGQWTESRYMAARDLKSWLVRLWHDADVPRQAIAEIKGRLAKLHKSGDAGVRDALLNGTLEHAFEDDEVAEFFKDWESDPELCAVYHDALLWKAWWQNHEMPK